MEEIVAGILLMTATQTVALQLRRLRIAKEPETPALMSTEQEHPVCAVLWSRAGHLGHCTVAKSFFRHWVVIGGGGVRLVINL
jgi:hypothetical protein